MHRRLDNLTAEFGVVLLAFFLLMELLCLKANLAMPVRLNEPLALRGLVIVGVYSLYLCFKPFWLFRPPHQ